MTTLDKVIRRMPRFMQPDLSRVEGFEDLMFQVVHEIDLAEEGEQDPKWTKRQLHQAKMYAANVQQVGGLY